jgi:hypothetical protein
VRQGIVDRAAAAVEVENREGFQARQRRQQRDSRMTGHRSTDRNQRTAQSQHTPLFQPAVAQRLTDGPPSDVEPQWMDSESAIKSGVRLRFHQIDPHIRELRAGCVSAAGSWSLERFKRASDTWRP